ncbi:phospholipase D-like domain-containing protein [Frondihabitans australicus]|uniref:phospholipase D n=1 Tax=Frondihabitans australicus TaxID=386892 RepID=A0A495IG03_9MICO|nr:phospholipase D-like domain-containing protein [Frondihabitans australicus]RKR74580.1 phospholipase D-like protein [Frondihabitans australicus]
MTDAASDIDSVIRASEAALTVPGVLSVRPGYLFRDGWITDERAIVVTVSDPAPSLPTSLEGVPVDVRVASPRKALQVQDPGEFARATGPAPDLGAVPEFADELRIDRGVNARFVPLGAPEHSLAEPLAAKPELDYTAPAGASLAPVDVSGVSITLSASPDSGWPTLSAFLGATSDTLTVGMYDFTSAHVLQTVETTLKGKKLRIVLDHPSKNPTADQTDETTVSDLVADLGDDLEQAWALDRMDPLASSWVFPTAYHIKVAVRDGKTVWVSSGNWNNSNQPDIDPVTTPGDATAARSGDRDWHVVIEHEGIASTFEAFLLHDLEVAAAHDVPGAAHDPAVPAGDGASSGGDGAAGSRILTPAVATDLDPRVALPAVQTPPFAQFFASRVVTDTTRITPVLTPDAGVYVGAVKDLVDSATTTLHMQFQYIELPKASSAASAPLESLVAAIVARQKAGVDVKIIMSEFEVAGFLEKLEAAGLDVVNSVKIQNNVHNKGVVVDGARVLVSSQNWSSAGVSTNRDAGVILDSADAADYFETIFQHDWANLAQKKALND